MKKSKMLLLLTLVLVISLGLTACGSKGETPKEEAKTDLGENKEEKSKDGGIMVLGVGSDPAIVNPLYADDRTSMTIGNVIFDNLYMLEDGQPVYTKLAESMEVSEDFLTYTLKLKEGLTWHDGKPLTSDDLIYTMETILDEKQGAKGRGALVMGDDVVEFAKVDDRTVEFTLPKVNMSFIENMAGIKPIPKHLFEGSDVAKNTANEKPVGSGPFKFKSSKSGELYEVERFDEYHGDVAKLDGIAYRVIPDTNSILTALENGEVSAAYLKANDVEKYQGNENLELVTFSEGMVNNLFFRISNKNVSDPKLRQAIAYGIDQDKIIQGAYGGDEYALPASSSFGEGTQFHTDEVEQYNYNPEKAKEILKEIGKENLELTLTYASGAPVQEKEALLIQEMLKEIGVKLELIPLERGTFYDKILDPENMDIEMALNGYVMGTNPDSYGSMLRSDSPNNFSGYKNEKIDQLFDDAKTETDEEKRAGIYKEIQKTIADEVVQYPTVYVKSIVAVNKEFKGLDEAKPASIHMFDYFNKISK